MIEFIIAMLLVLVFLAALVLGVALIVKWVDTK